MKRLTYDQLQSFQGGDLAQWMVAGNACGAGLPGSVVLFPNPMLPPHLTWLFSQFSNNGVAGCLEVQN